MHKTGGHLSYDPAKCCKLILTSLFLHNYYIRNKIPLSEEDELLAAEPIDDMIAPVGIQDAQSGITTRDNLVFNYFN